MEFITIFCIIYFLGFLFAGLGAIALFLMKGIIALFGALYYAGKWAMNTLKRLLHPFVERLGF